ncbi:hypothetical protein CWE04_11540 [Thomasclavelia cocleata]|uniref:Uncharacterized protein n=1 Tax=Thomasclavelia cocleata TaxID=69824 RepID=A0A1I0GC93_9FIRM|nr:hypothetical protein [Thomasclavelia cocleata]MCR1959843.1 hypothetical protein [Thomasclavelia cocleata]NDO43193.1 hypothetical protein [Thomasclavelia cocleata]PJN79836.1 hypothetical protein CWE04_11540 [Thomasclavelia cocleata]SET68517.1 hypothetical protein SAMN04489758_12818 [Thomasclavelia cocleata]
MNCELLNKYDVRVFKTFCRDIIGKCVKYDKEGIVILLRNNRMKNVLTNKDLGNKVFKAEKVLLSVLKQGNKLKYYLIIDGNKTELELGKLEKTLIYKEIHKFAEK